jgi:hypothetical protein
MPAARSTWWPCRNVHHQAMQTTDHWVGSCTGFFVGYPRSLTLNIHAQRTGMQSHEWYHTSVQASRTHFTFLVGENYPFHDQCLKAWSVWFRVLRHTHTHTNTRPGATGSKGLGNRNVPQSKVWKLMDFNDCWIIPPLVTELEILQVVPKISDVPILNRVHSILATWRVLDALTFEDSRIGCDRLRLWLLRCCHWSFWGWLFLFVPRWSVTWFPN